MKNIQLILLTAFVGGTTLYFKRMRSRLIDRVIVLSLTAVAATMVIVPQATDWLARGLGVGRGVDLVFCFMLVFLSYVCLLLYGKLRAYEARLVDLTRWIAINNPKLPEQFEESAAEKPRVVLARNRHASPWASAWPVPDQHEQLENAA